MEAGRSLVLAGPEPAILDMAVAGGAGLAVWRRPADPQLAAALRGGPPVADLRLAGAPAVLGRDLDDRTRERIGPALRADMQALLRRFAILSGAAELELRLEAVTGDACWKFHRDMVRLRLLTTYDGPATEYVTARHAERALQQQRDYRGPLRRLRPFDVALFRGARDAGGDAVVHRSPPIAGSGRTRLLFCLTDPGRV
ncbi:DUF1826 domain-containing protein [Marinibaculum pumilum]|uniref:DUF1826 domain-containing protein n=1 Tax=Marinibaculum pumilum TaxID=1766165 RepID=A0ABV7L9B2_9PROT